VVNDVLTVFPDISSLLHGLAHVSGRNEADLEREVREHLATRLAFLLLGEVEGAANFPTIGRRIRQALPPNAELGDLVSSVAKFSCAVESSNDMRRTSWADLPYPIRTAMLIKQGRRCGVCGWDFVATATEGLDKRGPTLDHKMPYRLGGDSLDNLWVLCALCNAIKESALHVGEHGRTWTNNFVYGGRRRSIAFWVMYRDKVCLRCGVLPSTTQLFVYRRHDRGSWSHDNCVTSCSGCGTGQLVDY